MESYVVGFKIFDGRALKSEDGEPCDPFVVVSCGEKTWQSATLKDRGPFVPWNDGLIWPAIDMYPKEFDSESIAFTVYAKNWFTRNYVIGEASLQLSFVNLRRHHLYARRLLQLRREHDTNVTGTLNISVYVLRPGQVAPSQTQLSNPEVEDNDDVEPDAEDLTDLKTAVLSSTVEVPVGKSSYVKLDIHRVDELRDMPASLPFPGGSPSPYVTVEFAGALLYTDVAPNVNEYTFNSRMQIPVVTPLYEDTILIKLWTRNWLSSDELLAQGLISFTELRNVGLEPRWFSLYGWNLEEIPDLDAISASGVRVEPNYFMGRLLLSGRVERNDDDEELEPAKVGAATTIAEPATEQVVLFADVYMVVGVAGRRCRVEISYGLTSESTKTVDFQDHPSDKTKMAQIEKLQKDHNQEEDVFDPGTSEDVNVFRFDEKAGQVEPLIAMIPTDPKSQARVMVSVYIEGLLQAEQRVGVQLFKLSDFQAYNYGRPPEPRFLSLNSMPNQASSLTQPSVLMALERHNTDTVQRQQRKAFKSMIYLVRAYCFMARNIAWDVSAQGSTPEDFVLRVSCSGISKTTTKAKAGPRPVWMEPVDLKLILLSHSTKEKPRMEPITVHLSKSSSLYTTDMGKAVCQYNDMRKQDSVGAWNEYELRPQWINVYGGKYNRTPMGEVLVAFEMMLWSNRDDLKLQQRSMWPYVQLDRREAQLQLSRSFDDDISRPEGFCQLKKATLHFSLFGLRDLLPLPRIEKVGSMAGSVHVSNPLVEVEVESFLPEPLDGYPNKIEFEFKKVVRNGDGRKKADVMKQWTSNIGHDGAIEATNFEMLQVQKMKCLIPENGVLESYITVRVFEDPPKGSWFSGRTLIGDARISLARAIPCCWLDDVDLGEPFKDQEKHIRSQLDLNEQQTAAQKSWQRDVASADQVKFPKKGSVDNAATERDLVQHHEEKEDFLDDTGLPIALRGDGGLGQKCARDEGKQLLLNALELPNMQLEGAHSPRTGETLHKVLSGRRDLVHGMLESQQPENFPFKKIPLLRNHDIFIQSDCDKDWNFQPGLVFGFVKCAFKLEDGWEEQDSDEEDEELSPPLQQQEVDPQLKRSAHISNEFNDCGFDEEHLQKEYKGEEGGVRATLQIALVKAVCVFSKDTGKANPYMEINLGRRHHVQMRNMAKDNTNMPEFWRVESRQIELPEDGRLELSVMDLEGFPYSDTLVGSTVIDLEDRWYSSFRNNPSVPTEKRPLYSSEHVDKVRGNLEMFLTIHDTSSEVKPLTLPKPAPVELEIRFVVWTCSKVRNLPDYEYVNPKLKFTLECEEHYGFEPKEQETDVHQNPAEGNAVFNWRVVFRKIRMPTDECSLTVWLYHHEALGDYPIGSLDLNLKRHLDKVQNDGDPLTTLPVDIPFQDMDTSTSAEEDDIGTINMEMTIMTQGEADGRKVGLGREEPNVDPQLITPEGRGWDAYFSTFSFPWPDFGLWKKAIPFILAGLSFLFSMVLFKYLGLL